MAEGETQPIAIAAPTRSLLFPEIPNFRELGHDIVVEYWTRLSGPASMDPAMVQTTHDTVEAIMKMEQVIAQLAQFSISHTEISAEEFNTFVQETITTWEPLIKAAKVNG
ncbi:tripartite tricarboxylate transporter substrate-binding protein [Sulfitobacter sp.]|uniref:tripartite tricarboxylate transporter substrate-binding protein n=1 Tax=Sulfitobacter sp. TaxID=1903071 RepID=UPI003EF61992